MLNPKPGNLFSEFLSYWVIVLDVQGQNVFYATKSPGAEWEYFRTNQAGFRSRYSYGNIKGYWVSYHSTKIDLADKVRENQTAPFVENPIIRRNKISQVVV